MSQLEEILSAINAAYAQIDGVSPAPLTPLTTVHDYLQLMDLLHADALRLTDEAISLAIAAGQYVDTTATLTILRGQREQLVELNVKIHHNLDGMGSNLTLLQAWDKITGGIGGDIPDDGNGNGDTGSGDTGADTGNGTTGGDNGNSGGGSSGDSGTPPVVYPDPDAVVLYGDTPMLLRANDPDVVIGTAYTLDSTSLVTTSPVISLDAAGVGVIGTHTTTSFEETREVISGSFISAGKNLLGEIFESIGFWPGNLALKAQSIYSIGDWMKRVANNVSGLLLEAQVSIQNGTESETLAKIEAAHQKYAQESEDMATTEIVGSIPGAGMTWGPLTEAYLGFKSKLQHSNSFQISISATDTIQGGNKGAVLFGGIGNDDIVAGNGDVFAYGGNGGDVFHPGTGKQFFAGGMGLDQVSYALAGANLKINKSVSGYQVSSFNGLHTFNDIERVMFTDRKVALDLSQGDSAANAVRLIGAALDAPALATTQLVGWFINEFDQGNSMKEAIQHAMLTPQFTTLMPQLSDTDFVTRVFHNVMGVDPNPSQLDYFLSLLSGHGGSMTQTDLLVLAANTAANAVNIDLVGLQQHGIDYL